MRKPVRQRFTLLDAMVLVASFALGLGLMKGVTLQWFLIPFDPIGPMSARKGQPWDAREWTSWATQTCQNRFNFLMPLLATLTVTVMALRLRPPRPRLSRLLRQPGIAGIAAATSVIAFWPPLLAILGIRGVLNGPGYDGLICSSIKISVAASVGSSWVMLLAGGRWRADPGWSDRLGRLLSVAWLVPLLLYVTLVMITE
jgi:hypothetical protein